VDTWFGHIVPAAVKSHTRAPRGPPHVGSFPGAWTPHCERYVPHQHLGEHLHIETAVGVGVLVEQGGLIKKPIDYMASSSLISISSFMLMSSDLI
jgi:hypothetical protein